MFEAPVPSPAPASAPPAVRAAWVSGRAFAPGVGIVRAPDGSMVTAEPIGKHGGHTNVVRITAGRSAAAPRVTSIGTPARRDPLNFASSGEAVFAITTGTGFRDFSRMLRIPGGGEVPGRGPTVLDHDTIDFASIFRLDHRRVGTVVQRPGPHRTLLQTAVLEPSGARFVGPTNTKILSPLFLFTPVSDETGTLVDVFRGAAWHYPRRPVPFDVPPRASGPPIFLDGFIGSSATGLGRVTVQTAIGSGRLKVQTYAKDGSVNLEGEGDAALAVITPGEPFTTAAVPIPAELDASCLAGSLTDMHGVRLGALWNGPDGDIWSIASCAGEDSSGGAITLRWLVHWNRATYASAIVRLPAGPRQALAGGGRGFTGPGGVMYVAAPGGVLAVSGFRAPATSRPRLVQVRRLATGRVRAEVSCVGTVGAACFGRIRFSDAGGALGTLRYGVDAGTPAMDPVVVRELQPRRVPRGAVRATLLR